MADRGQAQWFRSTSASSIGIEIALSIVMGTLAGKWIQDRYPAWSPWALLLGLAFGCAAAVGAVRRALRSYNKELEMVAGDEKLLRQGSQPDKTERLSSSISSTTQVSDLNAQMGQHQSVKDELSFSSSDGQDSVISENGVNRE